MARLVTTGLEMNRVGIATSEPDGRYTTGGAAVAPSSAVRWLGLGLSGKCDSGAGNATCFVSVPGTAVASTNYFVRAYLCFANTPTTNAAVLTMGNPASAGVSVRLTTSGTLILFNNETAAQIGSATSALTIDGATWYMVELQLNVDGSIHGSSATARLNGVQFATGSLTQTVTPTVVGMGWCTAPGANLVCYVDDIAVNDNTGAAQNSFPGSGKIVLLKPTATSAAGSGWTLGNGTAEGGNGWNSVDNEPPVGIADLGGAGADTGQIRNAAAAANSNFDATMTTYSAAGLNAGATVVVIDPIVCTAAPVTTSSKQGTVGVASNPAISNIALGALGTTGAFWSGTAGGVYSTGWKWSHGTTTYSPSVTLGTAPVMRVTQVTSSTRIAVVCFMGIYVEYQPGVDAVTPAAINTTSAVTASVQAQKGVTPAAINATSAMAAAVQAQKRFTPAAVSATSAMSAAVQAQKRVTPAAINATSAVTGPAIRRLRPVTPAAVTATSAVTATVQALKRVTPAAINATSSITASIAGRFPTTPVLDTFNRANEGPPPSANWGQPFEDANVLQVISNQVYANAASGYGGAYWSPTTFGPNTEVYCTLAAAGANGDFFLYARVGTPGAGGTTTTGYAVEFKTTTNEVKFWRVAGAYTQLGATVTPGTPLAIGDVVGFAVVGSTITAYQNGHALSTRTDSTYTAAGYIGFDCVNNAAADNFGGGRIGFLAPAAISATSLMSGPVIRRLRPVVPATFAASSAVTGSVQAQKRVTPAAINATSAVTGPAIRRLRPVTPAAVTATSAVTGSVQAQKRVTPAAVTATSAVTGPALRALRAVTPAALTATSVVTAGLIRLVAVHPAAVTASSTVTATVANIVPAVTAAITATSAIAATVTRAGVARAVTPDALTATSAINATVVATRPVVPAATTATSAVTATVQALKQFTPAAFTATSSITANALRVLRAVVPATLTATSAVTATLGAARPVVTSAISITSAVTAGLQAVRRVTPDAISATSAMTAAVQRVGTGGIVPITTITVTSAVTATVRALHHLAATLTATSGITASVQVVTPVLPGAFTATSTVTATVQALKRLVVAATTATSNVTASVRVITPVVPGAVTATSSVTASLRRRVAIVSGAITATSNVAATVLRVAAVRPGAITSMSPVTASLRRLVAIRPAAITVTSTVAGHVVALRLVLPGAIAASSSVTARVQRLVQIVPDPIFSTSTITATITFGARLDVGGMVATSYLTSTILHRLPGQPHTGQIDDTDEGWLAGGGRPTIAHPVGGRPRLGYGQPGDMGHSDTGHTDA